MAEIIKIKKGLDIKLAGRAETHLATAPVSDLFAIKPTDFHGLTPKLLVKVGGAVEVGSPLFYDKYNPDIKFVSPVSGELIDIVRGERRKVLELIVKSDGKNTMIDFGKADPSKLKKEDILARLLESGMWPFIKQRPFDVVANPAVQPDAIFVSGFDSAPLAPDYDFILSKKTQALQAGFDALSKIAKVNLGIDGRAASKVMKGIRGVQQTSFDGPHPAGNVGIQIHHVKPINKGDVIWVVNVQDVAAIGQLFLSGKYDATRTITLCGSEVINPAYYETTLGTSIEKFVSGNIKTDEKVRYISGNVLTGDKITEKGFLGAYAHQVTVIPEGEYSDFMGWVNPGFNKFSVHGAVWSKLFNKKTWRLDANLHGGKRAFVTAGEYEKVFPMDILPEFLLKAMIIKDIDKMEQLGVYEVAPEDFALCEVICTSKIESQDIVRSALDLIKEELG